MSYGQINLLDEIIVDSFAGGGGASTGIELAAGRVVDIAINHDPDAILMHRTNHPHTQHFQASVWDVDPEEVCRGRSVGLLWASPDCKHFSKAKGAALVDRNIRGLAWIVLRWAGTVRPRVIILENVEEFQTWGPVRRGKPVKKKACQTFRRFISQLEGLGYAVEYRELVAADYGAPTTRKRFVLVARCDGRPVVWPERTHDKDGADGLPKWRAEVSDCTQPCYSIFATKEDVKSRYGVTVVRPLADNTMRRVIRGVDKFVIKAKTPYIVPWTVTNTCNSVGSQVTAPVHTVTTAGNQLLLSPALIQYHTEQSENVRGQSVAETLRTVDASNRYGLVAASLTKYYSGEQQNQGITDPLHTITTKDREGLTVASLSKYFGGVVGAEMSQPLPTVTSVDHNALQTAHLVKMKGENLGGPAGDPVQTITAGGTHFGVVTTKVVRACPGEDLQRWPQVRECLNEYCGYSLEADEVILFRIGGAWYFIADVGLRMLTPRELYRANGFPDDYIIDRDFTGKEYGKSKQVARCGNAVPPPFATALVRANLPEWCGEAITTMRQFESKVAV